MDNKHYSPYAQAQRTGCRSNRITGLGGSITNSACSPDHWGAPEKAPCVPRRQACPPLSPQILHADGIRCSHARLPCPCPSSLFTAPTDDPSSQGAVCRRQKAAPAGTERSSLLHARLGGAASGCIAVQPASDEPVSHAPAVTDFSVKSLRCCAAMAGNVFRRNCITHWVWHIYIT